MDCCCTYLNKGTDPVTDIHHCDHQIGITTAEEMTRTKQYRIFGDEIDFAHWGLKDTHRSKKETHNSSKEPHNN